MNPFCIVVILLLKLFIISEIFNEGFCTAVTFLAELQAPSLRRIPFIGIQEFG